MSDLPFDGGTLAHGYAALSFTPRDVVREVARRMGERGDDGVWISRVPPKELEHAAEVVEARRQAGEVLPLYGIPFGVKDNIDVAGLPTTAACPAFAYTPDVSATAVSRLVAAGGIVVGKTNMDQFASGLVGVRSPYGVPRNPFDRDFVAGGSSSGSAVAVATGQVSFALGTDTAGSGRVPAAFNNIVGIKPSRGVVSTVGVVPACRSLDCVSVFASSCEEGARVAELMRAFDPSDPFSRPGADSISFMPPHPAPSTAEPFRFGVFDPPDRDFCGDVEAAAAFEAAIARARTLGATPVTIDMKPFREAGSLLYAGPFVAERLEAAGRLYAERPQTLLEPLRAILADAARHSAAAVFSALARLRLLCRQIAPVWNRVDFLLVPSAPTLPRVDAVERDPLRLNASLGLYTNFVNLLDLAAVAVPAGFRGDGLPAGVTLIGPWGSDARLAGFGARLHRASATTIGATRWLLPPSVHELDAGPARPDRAAPTSSVRTDEGPVIPMAVVGAHLRGEPLNHELIELGATFLRTSKTTARYRLFALAGTEPAKPGLLAISHGDGAAIEVELWALTPSAFGAFVARIPPPLGIGKLDLEDGTTVSGFLCEAHATAGALDISSFGGWRAYLRSVSVSSSRSQSVPR